MEWPLRVVTRSKRRRRRAGRRLPDGSGPAAKGASRPFFYGRWDEAAQAHATVGVSERHQAAREGYFAGATIDVPATRAALAKLTAPVLLYAGEADPVVTPAAVREAAPLFSDATVAVPPGAAHFPWIDDPAAFAAAVGSFLSRPPVQP